MSGRVLVVGSVNVDLVVQTERLPQPGETVLGGTFRRFHGGKGGNQAVAAARLGAPVMLVAALGDDEFGGDALAALAREGIGTDVLVTLEHTRDRRRADPRRHVRGEPDRGRAGRERGADRGPRPRPRSTRLSPHAGDVVIVTHEIPTDAAREALRIGREGGAWTVLNPAPADGHRPDDAQPRGRRDAEPRRARPAGGGRLAPVGPAHLGQRGPDPVGDDAARDDVRGPGRRARVPRLARVGRRGARADGTARRSTSPRRRSRRWTRRAPATRSTAPSPRLSPAVSTSSRRPGARSSRRRSR